MAKQFGLGKGLGALIPEPEVAAAIAAGVPEPQSSGEAKPREEVLPGYQSLPLSSLKPNPEQPRRSFSQASLDELASSIKTHGLIQPIVVERSQAGGYLIVAGERRYRASLQAGLQEVPVVIRSFSPQKRLEIALIENVQREDLNPVEEAEAYRTLMSMGGRSQEEVADVVGKSRSAVANSVRLLKLPDSMLSALKDGSITAGHAKALLSVLDPGRRDMLFARIVAEGISVREAEASAQEINSPKLPQPKNQGGDKAKQPEIRDVENRLIEALGTKVDIKGTAQKGTISIEYYSLDDLERILDVMAGR